MIVQRSNGDTGFIDAPPHDLDTEESVLASLLIDNDSISETMDMVSTADFYKTAHGHIYNAIIDTFKSKQPSDLITVTDSLRKNDHLESAGGAAYLARLIDHVPMATNLMHYVKILKGLSVRRQSMVAANEITKRAMDVSKKIEDVIEENQKSILSIDVESEVAIHRVNHDLMWETLERYERIWKDKKMVSGVPTGFEAFDNYLSGMQPADLLILAARPSMGKTAMAMQMVIGAAKAGFSPLVFSLEQPKEQLMDRFVANSTRMSTSVFRSGYWGKDSWANINEAISNIAKLPIYLDDRGGLSYKEIRKVARREKRINDISLIVIDHLQLISGAGNKSRNDEVGLYTREFKALAKELKIPVLVLSQLSRALEQRTNKRPVLSDLRDSGNIEQDADVVAFIYRDEVYNKDAENPNRGKAELIIAKQRQGPLGVVHMNWLARSTRFDEAIQGREGEPQC